MPADTENTKFHQSSVEYYERQTKQK